MVDINKTATFIFPNGWYRTIDLTRNPSIRGIKHNGVRPIVAIIPESERGTEFHLKAVRFALSPISCEIQFRPDSATPGRLRPTAV